MARIRYIKPEFFEDQQVSSLSILARLFYIGLFCLLDKHGVVEDSPKLFRAKLFPFDDEITSKKVSACVDELIHARRLFRVTFEGREYLYCPTLVRHQHFHPKERAKYLIPDDVLRASVQPLSSHGQASVQQGASTSLDTVQPLSSRVGNGNGEWVMGNGEGNGNEPVTDSEPSLTPQTLADLWNAHCGDLPKISKLTDQRRAKATAQIRKYPDEEHWMAAIRKFTSSAFCREQWKPGFDAFIDEGKRLKAYEGCYDDKSPLLATGTGGKPNWAQSRQTNNLDLLRRVEAGEL